MLEFEVQVGQMQKAYPCVFMLCCLLGSQLEYMQQRKIRVGLLAEMLYYIIFEMGHVHKRKRNMTKHVLNMKWLAQATSLPSSCGEAAQCPDVPESLLRDGCSPTWGQMNNKDLSKKYEGRNMDRNAVHSVCRHCDL